MLGTLGRKQSEIVYQCETLTSANLPRSARFKVVLLQPGTPRMCWEHNSPKLQSKHLCEARIRIRVTKSVSSARVGISGLLGFFLKLFLDQYMSHKIQLFGNCDASHIFRFSKYILCSLALYLSPASSHCSTSNNVKDFSLSLYYSLTHSFYLILKKMPVSLFVLGH